MQNLGVAKINRVFGRLKHTKIHLSALRLIIDHFRNGLEGGGGPQTPKRLADRWSYYREIFDQ